MWDSSFDLNVNSEQELIDLVQAINDDIEFQNLTKEDEDKQEPLDINYLLKRYRTIKRRDAIEDFREEHDCAHCFYYEKPRRCKAIDKCFLDEDEVQNMDTEKKTRCSRDSEGTCPYGNEVGTCFGYCWKEILDEFKEKKRQEEKRNE